MRRLLRFMFGGLLILVAVSIGLRYGEPAYLSHVGRPAEVTVAAPCTVERFLTFDKTTRCQGTWTDGGANRSGAVIAADPPTMGRSIPARVLGGDAFVRPAGASLILGYASIPLGLVGLFLALTALRRRRRSGRPQEYSSYDNYDGYDYGDPHADYRGYDQPGDNDDNDWNDGGDDSSGDSSDDSGSD